MVAAHIWLRHKNLFWPILWFYSNIQSLRLLSTILPAALMAFDEGMAEKIQPLSFAHLSYSAIFTKGFESHKIHQNLFLIFIFYTILESSNKYRGPNQKGGLRLSSLMCQMFLCVRSNGDIIPVHQPGKFSLVCPGLCGQLGY